MINKAIPKNTKSSIILLIISILIFPSFIAFSDRSKHPQCKSIPLNNACEIIKINQIKRRIAISIAPSIKTPNIKQTPITSSIKGIINAYEVAT